MWDTHGTIRTRVPEFRLMILRYTKGYSVESVRRTIAIVDDDKPIVTFMEDLFAAEGYATIAWQSGAGAHDLIRREQPGLVIIDLWMEHHDAGWDVLCALRADPITAAIPVVICSADSRALRGRGTVECRTNCVIVEKPFDVETLLHTVSALVASS